MFLPVGPPDWPLGERLRVHYAFRLGLLGAVLLLDLVLYLVLRQTSFARQSVVQVFLLTNVAAVGLDLALSAMFLRRSSRAYPWVIRIGTGLEMCATMAWMQMTGSTTSYFIGLALTIPLFLRLVYDYWTGVVAVVVMLVLMVLIHVLEATGVWHSASLFASGPLAVEPPLVYRVLVSMSMSTCVVVVFVGANLMSSKWMLSRQELAKAQSQLRRVAEEAHIGRLSGTTLGKYRVEELLGRGGMGEVYAAWSGGKEVAVKLLHAHLGADIEMRGRFRREAEVVTRMPAGTVAAVHEHGTSADGYDYIVMERLHGEDIGALLRRRSTLPLGEVVAIITRAARALDAAHEQGVVHRDLKPQNIFICSAPAEDGGPDVRLLDFGVARLFEATASLTMTAAVMGTPGYMAPEQADGRVVGPPADVFAIGAMVYRALTGRPAFSARSAAAALFELLNHEPPPVSSLDPSLPHDVDAVLALALAKNPAERYQKASELARDLALAARGELPAATRVRAEKLMRRSDALLDTMTA